MAGNDRIVGIAVLAAFVIMALAYTFYVGRPSSSGANAGKSSVTTSVGSTKIVVYGSQNSTAQNAAASGSGQTGSTTTSAVVAASYIPIVIRNSQPNATPLGFQEMIVVPSSNYSKYMADGWNNVEFSTLPGGKGEIVPAWIESNATSSSNATVVWLKLPAPISPNNETTIYMDFMGFQTLSRNGPLGEAPQLSPLYAQYDNGGKIFNFYENFAGTNLNSSMWTNDSAFSSNPIRVADGLTIGRSTSNQDNGYGAVMSVRAFGQGVLDFYGTIAGNSTRPHYQDVGLVPASENNACNLIDVGSFYGPHQNGLEVVDSYCNAKYSAGLRFGSPTIYSIFVPSIDPASVTATVNYSSPLTIGFTSVTLPQTIGFENQGDVGNLGPIYWIRQRDYPPGGVMPSARMGRPQ